MNAANTRSIGLSVLGATQETRGRVVQVEKIVMARNREIAAQNRERFHALGLHTLNVVSAPGSGKTELLARTLHDLSSSVRAAVIVGDLATDRDAQRFERAGCTVAQIQTGSLCHLEADMIAQASQALDLEGRQLLVIENVGNLVCPAGYDLGEDERVVLMSVTEGEDKPLKYPVIFKSAHTVLITKTDLAAACDFDRALALENIRTLAPNAAVFEVSARSGSGLEAWYEHLRTATERVYGE